MSSRLQAGKEFIYTWKYTARCEGLGEYSCGVNRESRKNSK